MKATKPQLALAVLASALLMLCVFQQPLGLPDTWGMIFAVAALVCWVVYFVLRRRQKARSAEPVAPTPPPEVASRQKAIRLLSVFLLVLVSLSSPWWLPFTGTQLPFPQMVVVAVISCVACVTVYLIASRNRTPKA